MRALIENMDWAATPLGARTRWPANLQAVVSVMLDSPEAMLIWWGNDLLQIYNVTYAHRVEKSGRISSLGEPAAAQWQEVGRQ